MTNLTPEKVSDLSDWDVNVGIAEIVMSKHRIENIQCREINDTALSIYMPNGTFKKVDYCNNWNDLMPLVIEHGIALTGGRDGEDWYATKEFHCLHHKDPQRALAECVFLVLQSKRNEL